MEDWQHFLDRPRGKCLFRQWRVRTRRRAIRFCALRLGLGPLHRNLAREVGRRVATEDGLHAAKRGLYGLAYARSLEELAKLGLGVADRGLLRVVPDLSIAVQWGLHPSLCDWQRRRTKTDMRAMATFFERSCSTVTFHLHDALRSLARLVGETL